MFHNKFTVAAVFVVLGGATLLSFQNCAETTFVTGESANVQGLDADLLIEKGHKFTNKKIVDVEFNIDISEFKRFKVARNGSFEGQPFQGISKTFQADLADEWAADGSKDGEKIIKVELYSDFREPTVLEQGIGLDTVHPSIEPQGLLATGAVGAGIPFGTNQKIQWSGEDVPAPNGCLLYTSPSPRDQRGSRMPSSA